MDRFLSNLYLIGVFITFLILSVSLTSCGEKVSLTKKETSGIMNENIKILNEAVEEIKTFDRDIYFISTISKQPIRKEIYNESEITGLYSVSKDSSGGNGKYTYEPIVNKALDEVVSIKKMNYIHILRASGSRECIRFSFSESNSGLYYSEDGMPFGQPGSEMDLDEKDSGWMWKSLDGNKWYYTEKITDNWYYYESNM